MTIWENAQFWFNVFTNADYDRDGEAMIRFDCEGTRQILAILPADNRSAQGFVVRFNLMNNFDFLVTFRVELGDRKFGTNDYYTELPEFASPPRLRLTNENINSIEDVEHIMVVGMLRGVFNHVCV